MGDLRARIEHTLLRPDARAEDVEEHCREAARLSVLGACVAGRHAALARRVLSGSGVRLVTVVGFPLGSSRADVKAFEAARAVDDGADEIDVVVDLGGLKAGDRAAVVDDVRGVVAAAQGRPVKVILETALLSDAEKILGCELAREGGASFVKTSTGFGPGGATASDVALLRRHAAGLLVKASGGIRTRDDALRMIEAGADRLGTSASRAILEPPTEP